MHEPIQNSPSEEDIFLESLEYPEGQDRDNFIKQTCAGDSELEKNVISLLRFAGKSLIDTQHEAAISDEREKLHSQMNSEREFFQKLKTQDSVSFGDYTISKELGRGGMAVVYQAHQESLNREVALKIVFNTTIASPSDRKRFQVEAEAAAQLNHPNIVPIYEVGNHLGHDFYSMELMYGGALSHHLKQHKLSPKQAVAIIIKVTDAIQSAHQKGVIHRDLKPDNILLDEQLEPHIADFGLAYWLNRDSQLTITGQLLGTPRYLPPEQLEGRKNQSSTASDIYSIGTILYEILAGKSAFEGDSVLTVLEKVKLGKVAPLKKQSIDKDLETIVMKCLERAPEDRYSSAKALSDDLRLWQGGYPISARSPSTSERLKKWIIRHPLPFALILITSIFLLTLSIGGPLIALQQKSLKEEAQAANNTSRIAREQAETEAHRNRLMAYYANMRYIKLASSYTGADNLFAETTINLWNPEDSDEDARGWEWYYLNGKIYQEPRHLPIGSKVNSISFSPAGDTLLLNQRNGSWTRHTLTSSVIRHYGDGKQHIAGGWAQHGETVLTLAKDGTISHWETRTGKILHTLKSKSPFIQFTNSPSSNLLLTLNEKQVLELWQWLPSQAQYKRIDSLKPDFTINKIGLSPDAEHLACVGESKQVLVIKIDSCFGKQTFYQAHEENLIDLAWEASSQLLATASETGRWRIWNVPGGERFVRSTVTPNLPITSLHWIGGSKKFIFSLDGKTEIREIDIPFAAGTPFHESEKEIKKFTWNDELLTLAVIYDSGEVGLFRKELPQCHHQLLIPQFESSNELFWNDNSSFDIINFNGKLTRFNTLTGIKQEAQLWETKENILSIDKLKNSDLMLTLSNNSDKTESADSSIRIYEKTDLISTTKTSIKSPFAVKWMGHNHYIIAGNKGDLELRSLSATQETIRFEKPAQSNSTIYTHFQMSPDATHLLAIGLNNTTTVWSVSTGALVQHSQLSDTSPITAFTWSPNGESFAIARDNGTISLYPLSATDGRHLQTEELGITALAWHPDGVRLAAAGADSSITLWDANMLKQIISIKKHPAPTIKLAWSPNGLVLTSIHEDGTVEVFDSTAGVLLSSQNSKIK